MLVLIGLTACLWFGLGLKIGIERAKSAYGAELASYPALSRLDPIAIKRDAVIRSISVFLGWTVAGLVGAVAWAILWTVVLVAKATARERAPTARGRQGNGIIAELVMLGIFAVGDGTIRALERNADDCAIYFSLASCGIAVVIYSVTR
jgi:hypothetical protein